MTDRIQRQIKIKAPISRVWRAITDHREFGIWFKVKIDQPFQVGARSTGFMTYPGYEHLKWEAQILKMEPNKFFALEWPPYVEDASVDLSKEPWLLVEFALEEISDGTLVTVTESGFDKLSPTIKLSAKRGNEEGWKIQMDNMQEYVSKN